MARVLRVSSPGKVAIGPIDAERPLAPGEVRLEGLMSAISHGTEINFVRGAPAFTGQYFDAAIRAFVPGHDVTDHDPDVLGYEMVGVVTEVADGVSDLTTGDLIHTGTPHQDRTILNVRQQREFGYPVTVLPRDKPLEPAVFISLGSVALQAIHDARIKVGDRVLVMGLGAIGLLTVQLAVMAGASQVVAVDPINSRRELARTLGATMAVDPGTREGKRRVGLEVKRKFGPGGVDVAIETSGSYAALHEAVASVGMGGRVVSVGFYQGDGVGLRLGEEWHHNRPDLISSMGVWSCPHRDYPLWTRQRLTDEIRDVLYSGRIKTQPLISARIPFERAQEGYDCVLSGDGEVIKVVLVYDR